MVNLDTRDLCAIFLIASSLYGNYVVGFGYERWECVSFLFVSFHSYVLDVRVKLDILFNCIKTERNKKYDTPLMYYACMFI